MKRTLKIISLVLSAVMIIGLMPVFSLAETTGINGDNLSYTLDASGTLTLKGSGAMADRVIMNYDREKVKKIIIGNEVTVIGIDAFRYFDALEAVEFMKPSKVQRIDAGAFEYCSALKSIEFPNSVKFIDKSAFSGSGVTAFKTESGNTEYSADSQGLLYRGTELYLCPQASALTEITVPENVTKIGESAFRNVNNLQKITINENTEIIDDSAFQFAKMLETVVFAGTSKLKLIGKSAFAGISYLKDFALPASVATVEEYAFANSGLTALTFPAGIKSIGSNVISNSGVKELIFEEGCSVSVRNLGYGIKLSKLSVPDTVDISAGTVNSLGLESYEGSSIPYYADEQGAIYSKDKKVLLFIPGDITEYAIPEGTETIEKSVIYNKAVEKLSFPASLREIMAGNNFSGLKSLTADENWMCTMQAFMFSGSPWYNSLPDGLIILGKTVLGFKGEAPADKKITIPEGIKGIAANAFYGLSWPEEVSFPASLEEIGAYAFYNCRNLNKINIPEENSLYKTGDYIFANTSVSRAYFGNILLDYSLLERNAPIKEGVTGIAAGAFSRVDYSYSIVIPASVKYVSRFAFDKSSKLVSLTYEDSADTEMPVIRDSFFSAEYLKTLEIPGETSSIDFTAFDRMLYLEKLIINENNPYFTLENGIIYNKDKTVAYKCINALNKEEKIVLPDTVEIISDYAFYGCNAKEIVMPVALREIGEKVFYESYKLEKADLSKCADLEKIGNNTFEKTAIKELYIPGKLTEFTPGNLLSLEKYEASPDNPVFRAVDGVLYKYDILINYPSEKKDKKFTPVQGTKKLGDNAFYNQNYLEEIILPSSVSSADTFAIHKCFSLMRVGLPDNNIEMRYSFDGCGRLARVDFNACRFTGSVPLQTGIFGEKNSLAEKFAKENNLMLFSPDYNPIMTEIPEIPAKCKENGRKAYYKTSDGTEYIDTYGVIRKTEDNSYLLTIKAAGHKPQKKISAEYLISPATCLNYAEYHVSCAVCGEIMTQNDMPGYGDPVRFFDRESGKAPHAFDKKVTNEDTLKSPANLDRGAEYYYTCSVCGEISDSLFFVYGDPLPAGDVDMDGKITAADARKALRASVGLEILTPEQLIISEVDGSEGITSADARFILRMSVGLQEYIKK